MNNSETKYYKAFDKNLKCRDMQYEVGKEYTFDGDPIICQQGFHFCKSVADCYDYYDTTEDTRICEVLPLGKVDTDEIKYCTNKIKIVKEIENPREKSNVSKTSSGYCNSGEYNSGDGNSGNYNSGHRNYGDGNSGYGNCGDGNSGYYNNGNYNNGNYNNGDHNSGDYNSGYRNSGDYNSGNWNTGDCNSGNCNSGAYNSGNWNTGDYNSGNKSNGIFNTEKKPRIKIFDKESNWTMDDWYQSKAYRIMSHCPLTYTSFIKELCMTDEEKEKHPEYKTLGGYLKTIIATQKKKQIWWDELPDCDKQDIYALPNFDADKFEMCTEIKVSKKD